MLFKSSKYDSSAFHFLLLSFKCFAKQMFGEPVFLTFWNYSRCFIPQNNIKTTTNIFVVVGMRYFKFWAFWFRKIFPLDENEEIKISYAPISSDRELKTS